MGLFSELFHRAKISASTDEVTLEFLERNLKQANAAFEDNLHQLTIYTQTHVILSAERAQNPQKYKEQDEFGSMYEAKQAGRTHAKAARKALREIGAALMEASTMLPAVEASRLRKEYLGNARESRLRNAIDEFCAEVGITPYQEARAEQSLVKPRLSSAAS